MKSIKVFQTSDGKTFTDRTEAKRHENELQALISLRKLLHNSINSSLCRAGNIDNVLKHILFDAPDVIATLQTYRKQMPKEKTPEVVMEAKAA